MKEGLDLHAIEKEVQEFWESEKIFSFDEKSKKKIFSIDTPPPTVSGELHIGHAMSYIHQDIIARYKRMQGYNVLYPFGFDDNGLPTERYIERKLGKKAKEIGIEKFKKICFEESEKIEKRWIEVWKKIALSADFSLLYRTIDERCKRISQYSFIELFKKGRSYRKEAPIMWCPECKTAVAQVELQDKEEETFFCDIIFETEKMESFVVSTTRPEMLGACVAVFYNPQDERYKKLKHNRAIVPIYNHFVPILEDRRVDINKGTGIVMCCTFGDTTDIEWWKAYGLPYKKIIDEEGKLGNLAGKYSGMSIEEARKAIIEDLKKEGKLVQTRKIKHTVNVHERCGTKIEFLVTKQWFIKYLDLKEKFLELGKKVKWFPAHMFSRYENWVKGLQWDWCISRQRYFGVPFPVWYCKRCETVILAKEKQLPVDPSKDEAPTKKCPKCKYNKFVPEKDVMDTWATSSLTPEIVKDLVAEKNKKIAKKLLPLDLRPQAHDIISFWAFNTIVRSWFAHKNIPWYNIMISGWCLDEKGKKMSKSKGNIIEPEKIIEKYCSDALHFWAASAKLGEDLWFSEREFIAAKKLLIKLWNAFQFLKIHAKEKPKKKELQGFDKFILLETNELIKKVTDAMEKYDYTAAKLLLEKFFWHSFCDNFIEILKFRLYQGKEEEKNSARYVLYETFVSLLKMLAPILPHMTEYIWQNYFKEQEKSKSVHLAEWPKYKKIGKKEEEILKAGRTFLKILERVRREKARANKSLRTEIILKIKEEDYDVLEKEKMLQDLKAVTAAREIGKGNFEVFFV
ncbi:MAG: valine--tRNA ligase [Candidatus Pacearchaeota archaeon]|nr:valine--tRNA ligase [Candidatus Pacearchaeota archaeon]